MKDKDIKKLMKSVDKLANKLIKQDIDLFKELAKH